MVSLIWRESPQWAMASGFLDQTNNGEPQSVIFLWTSDQLVAEISTWQHITHTTDKRSYPWWYSNPPSQQAIGGRITP